MAGQRIGETGLTDAGPSSRHHHHHHHLVSYSVLHGLNNPTTFMNQESSAFDFGELEDAIVMPGARIRNDEAKASLFTAGGRPAATLDMFPSWPIRFQQTPRGSSKSGGESTDSGSGVNTLSTSRIETQKEPQTPISQNTFSTNHHPFDQKYMQNQHQHLQQQPHQQSLDMASDVPSQNQSPISKPSQDKRKGAVSTSEKPLDAKTLRRLAQNREAARKSRLRKKAYVQQLESSRIKLSQLEQDLQRARSQGFMLGGCGPPGNISSGAAIFDMEYSKWLEDDLRHMAELRTGLHAHLPDGDLRVIVDGYVAHYDEIFKHKVVAAKSDVFHLITGMWTTPAERCFLWMGGFRPSELIKMLTVHLDPLTDQQLMGIYNLQQSTQQAEEALSQGLDQLQQSLVETIAASPVIDGMQQMAVALSKLANLEGFVRQADNLRQQTIHQLRRTLTVRQAARCFLVIGEYYGRLRALSSLWASRPRETSMNDDNSCQTTTDLQIVQAHNHHHHFANF